jgi:hypothetical protein
VTTLTPAKLSLRTTSRSAGRDCCSSTKATLRGAALHARFAIELDEQEQSGLPLRRCMEGDCGGATAGTDGLGAEEVAWLLEHAPGEVVVLRPADDALAA